MATLMLFWGVASHPVTCENPVKSFFQSLRKGRGKASEVGDVQRASDSASSDVKTILNAVDFSNGMIAVAILFAVLFLIAVYYIWKTQAQLEKVLTYVAQKSRKRNLYLF